MSGRIKQMVDRTLVYYLIVGILNFIICTGLMFFLFNVCGFSDHIAPLFNYSLGSLIWYVACRYLLFPDQKTTPQQVFRFLLEVVVVYCISYYLLAPLLGDALLRSQSVRELFSFGGSEAEMIQGNCEMTIGTVAYAILNYFGQRYFVFSTRFEYHGCHHQRTSK